MKLYISIVVIQWSHYIVGVLFLLPLQRAGVLLAGYCYKGWFVKVSDCDWMSQMVKMLQGYFTVTQQLRK